MQTALTTQVAPVAAAAVAARTARMSVLVAQVSGGELFTRLHRDGKGRIASISYYFQGHRIDRATAMRVACRPRASVH